MAWGSGGHGSVPYGSQLVATLVINFNGQSTTSWDGGGSELQSLLPPSVEGATHTVVVSSVTHRISDNSVTYRLKIYAVTHRTK